MSYQYEIITRWPQAVVDNMERNSQRVKLSPVLGHTQLHRMSPLAMVVIATGYHGNTVCLTMVGTMRVFFAPGSMMRESRVSFSW